MAGGCRNGLRATALFQELGTLRTLRYALTIRIIWTQNRVFLISKASPAVYGGSIPRSCRSRSKTGGAAEILDWLNKDPQALAIFHRTESAEGDLDPFFVVPTDVRVQGLGELLDAR